MVIVNPAVSKNNNIINNSATNNSRGITTLSPNIILSKINDYRFKNNNSLDSKVYPYFNSFKEAVIELASIKYLTNISFYMLLFSYITKIDILVKILLPINISNCLIFFLIVLLDSKEYLIAILGNESFNKIPKNTREKNNK